MAEQIVREDVEKLIQALNTCAEAIAAGKRYLEAAGMADETAMRKALVGESKGDTRSIDDPTVFASSPDGETVFGKEAVAATKTTAEAAKANGKPNYLHDACQVGARTLREAGGAWSGMASIWKELSLLQCECLAYGSAKVICLFPQSADEHDLEDTEERAKLLAASEEKEELVDCGLPVAVRTNDWMRELAPWEVPQPSGNSLFGDGVPASLEKLLSLIPALRTCYDLPGDCPVLLDGYSLAGFFLLWASCWPDAFAAVAAASSLFWFQGFMEYQRGRTPHAKVLSLNLGDREERARSEMTASCGNLIRQCHEQLSERMQPSTLVSEWNPDDHFDDNVKRMVCASYLVEKMPSHNAGKAL